MGAAEPDRDDSEGSSTSKNADRRFPDMDRLRLPIRRRAKMDDWRRSRSLPKSYGQVAMPEPYLHRERNPEASRAVPAKVVVGRGEEHRVWEQTLRFALSQTCSLICLGTLPLFFGMQAAIYCRPCYHLALECPPRQGCLLCIVFAATRAKRSLTAESAGTGAPHGDGE